MKLYTERRGIRAPLEKTYSINKDMYSLLYECCKKYKKNLIHIFNRDCHDDFTGKNYIAFNEKGFETKIKIKIPALFRDEYDTISVPSDWDEYNQYALLDFIEYFAQNIQDIHEYWNDNRYQNYKIIDCLDTSDIFEIFQQEVNEIFADSGLLYELTDERIIERIIENSTLTKEMENNFEVVNENGIRALLKDAIALYKTPNPTARQDSVEKIWDALERLKTYYTTLNKRESAEKIANDMANGNSYYFKLFNTEFRALTDIGNECRIRHHETSRVDIIDERYYDYFFNRCLSLIALAVQYLI